jgi:hypothetical protein
MTLYIGVDIHARQQTLSYLDTADGTTGQLEGPRTVATQEQRCILAIKPVSLP